MNLIRDFHMHFHVNAMLLLVACCGIVHGQSQTASTETGRESKFASNLVIGYSQVAQWYPSFEQVAGDEGWELLWQPGAGVDRWSKPEFDGWRRPIQSACKLRSGDPDRVLLSVSGPYGDDEEMWLQKINETIKVIRSKYKNVQQIVLLPVVGGPGNSRAARQQPVIVRAIERAVKGDKTGIVRAGPKPRVPVADDFRDAKGHLTDTAARRIGREIGEHFRQ